MRQTSFCRTLPLKRYNPSFAEEFGFKIDDVILNGTGSGQPLGILNSPALVTVEKKTGRPTR